MIRSSPRDSCSRKAVCLLVGSVSKCSCVTITEPGTGPDPGLGVGWTSGQSAMQQPQSE